MNHFKALRTNGGRVVFALHVLFFFFSIKIAATFGTTNFDWSCHFGKRQARFQSQKIS